MRKQNAAIVLIVLVAIGACKKKEEEVPVATVTAIDTTPTGGTIATATIALNEPDKQFVIDATTAILGETAFAKSADLMSPDTNVKAFGHLLVLDFADMLAELTRLGEKRGVIMPTEVRIEVAASNEALQKLKGKEFDRVYLQHVIDDHVAMIALFDAESKIAGDDELRDWVAKTTPKLQAHLDKARQLMSKV